MAGTIEGDTVGTGCGRGRPLCDHDVGGRIDYRDDILVLDVEVDPVSRWMVHHSLRNAWNGDAGQDFGHQRVDNPYVHAFVVRHVDPMILRLVKDGVGGTSHTDRVYLPERRGIEDRHARALLHAD